MVAINTRPEIIEHLTRKELKACRRIGAKTEMFSNVGYVDQVFVDGELYSIPTVYSPTAMLTIGTPFGDGNQEGNAITMVFKGDLEDFTGMYRFHGWLLSEEEAIKKHIETVNDFLDGKFEYVER